MHFLGYAHSHTFYLIHAAFTGGFKGSPQTRWEKKDAPQVKYPEAFLLSLLGKLQNNWFKVGQFLNIIPFQ